MRGTSQYSRRSLEQITERAARRHGVPPNVLKALIGQESGWRVNARSGAGAQGIAQFMPATAKAYGVNLNDGDPRDDIEGAAKYIGSNLKRTGGNVDKALSIYNSGRPDAYKDPNFAGGQTFNYVRSIDAAAKKMGPVGSPSTRGGGPAGITLQHGTEKLDVTDPELQRRQFFAQWMTQHNPNSPLVKLGVLDPNMATTKQVNLQTTTGFKLTGGGSGGGGTGAATGSAARAVQAAQKRIGIGEVGSSNRGKKLDDWERRFGMLGQAWCGIFVGLALQKAGVKGVTSRVASVSGIEEDARAGRNGFSRFLSANKARPGDALIVRRGGHVGLVESVDKNGTIHTIEGNTSTGKVQRRTHTAGSVYGVARPRF